MVEILLVYKKNFESVHDESLDYVTQTLTELIATYKINFDSRPRESVLRADFLGRDLVIVLGGDGTLTSISHNIDDSTPVMGVNSHPRDEDPEGSFGFYMDSNIHTFKQDILDVLEGKAIVNDLPRLHAIIDSTSGNRFTTDPALNDLLIANTHQYAPSKYHLRRGDQKCRQQSSGLLFSTWLGQGAWFSHSIDKTTLQSIQNQVKLSEISTHYFVVARDLPHSNRTKENWSWVDWTQLDTIMTSDMHRGYVVPDGWDEVHFNRGATVTVNAKAPSLRLLTFRISMDEKLRDLMKN